MRRALFRLLIPLALVLAAALGVSVSTDPAT
jgi:hypothetical protein